jgi:pimeloyl-ACP methyl ester carboxylesterase
MRIAATDQPSMTLVMLHGIYGRGRNWLAVARALTQARREYASWLLDLPHHGESGPGFHGDTVRGLAADLMDWLGREGLTADAILGHSYGGKVALAMAERAKGAPLQIWVVDSTPEVKPPSGSAWTMLQIIRRLPERVASRDVVIDGIVEGGFPPGVAQWMSTNLVRDGEAFVWRLDFDVMERLLDDFFETDLWNVVESPAPRHDIHFLKASQSSAVSDEAVRRIAGASGNRVHLHHREGGHWIHAESPEVVTQLLVETLPIVRSAGL